jgi:hypothetical protein
VISEDLLDNQDNSEAVGRNAYLAGLVDGEGCIYVQTYYGRQPGKKYCLYLELSMCSEPTIQWVQKRFGGRYRTAKPYGVRKRVQYHWRVSNDLAIDILKLIYPYLITKKRQAALAFKFRKVAVQTAWKRGLHRTKLRDDLVRRIKELNWRERVPKAVETVRKVRGETPEMIQSGLHGDMQESPETTTR